MVQLQLLLSPELPVVYPPDSMKPGNLELWKPTLGKQVYLSQMCRPSGTPDLLPGTEPCVHLFPAAPGVGSRAWHAVSVYSACCMDVNSGSMVSCAQASAWLEPQRSQSPWRWVGRANVPGCHGPLAWQWEYGCIAGYVRLSSLGPTSSSRCCPHPSSCLVQGVHNSH